MADVANLAEPAGPAVLEVVHRVSPECVDAFDHTVRGMIAASAGSSGRLGFDVIKPSPGPGQVGEWHLIMRYATETDLRTWLDSKQARAWQSCLDAITDGSPRVQCPAGPERLTGRHGQCHPGAPPKWKSAIVSGVAIYPLILFVPAFLAPLVRDAPRWLTILIQLPVMIPLMTWVTLPLATLLFGRWLSGNRAELQPRLPSSS